MERQNEREVAAGRGSVHAEGREEEEVVSVSCRSMRKVAGSCVGGIVVSIAAFQAVDPGSIPGQRMPAFLLPASKLCPAAPVQLLLLPRWPSSSPSSSVPAARGHQNIPSLPQSPTAAWFLSQDTHVRVRLRTVGGGLSSLVKGQGPVCLI